MVSYYGETTIKFSKAGGNLKTVAKWLDHITGDELNQDIKEKFERQDNISATRRETIQIINNSYEY